MRERQMSDDEEPAVDAELIGERRPVLSLDKLTRWN
jgi:hypothetical protein